MEKTITFIAEDKKRKFQLEQEVINECRRTKDPEDPVEGDTGPSFEAEASTNSAE